MTIDQVVAKPTNIHQALSRAKREIGVIGKDDKNEHHGYSFRGIDAIVNRVGPIFAELGIITAPVHRLISSEDVLSGSNAKGYRVIVESTWTFSIHVDRDAEDKFTVPDTSSITVQTLGEAIDYSDKAINQAQRQSEKNALQQVLEIPTGEPDPDSVSPEQIKPPTPGEKILEALIEEGMNKTTARKYTTEAMGELDLKNPIEEASIDAIVGEAIRLRDKAEAPLESDESRKDPEESPGE